MVQIIYRFKYRTYLNALVLFNLFVSHTHAQTHTRTRRHARTRKLTHSDWPSVRRPRFSPFPTPILNFGFWPAHLNSESNAPFSHFAALHNNNQWRNNRNGRELYVFYICLKMKQLDLVVTLVCLFVCGNKSFPYVANMLGFNMKTFDT